VERRKAGDNHHHNRKDEHVADDRFQGKQQALRLQLIIAGDDTFFLQAADIIKNYI